MRWFHAIQRVHRRRDIPVLAMSALVGLGLVFVEPTVDAAPSCSTKVVQFQSGLRRPSVCPEDARKEQLLIVDLSDAWVPLHFQGTDGRDEDAPPYRSTYLALADEHLVTKTNSNNRYLEHYGILPTFRVVLERLRQSERHSCHDVIDSSPLVSVSGVLIEETLAQGRMRIDRARTLRRRLEHQRARHELSNLGELGARSSHYRRQLNRLERLEGKTRAIEVLQQHLQCDALLERAPDGILSWATTSALRLYQRRHALRPTATLDTATRLTLARSAEENDVRTALRVLRERVAEAASLIEDGTAGAHVATIAGRVLDDPLLIRAVGATPLADAAPDRIGETTNQVAAELGWVDAHSIRSFLEDLATADAFPSLQVAVRAPPEPSYHSAHMELEVVVDPGDARKASRGKGRTLRRRPTLTLYAIEEGRRIPLVRWPTTVGGWQEQRLPGGELVKRYMASDQGSYVWRDLYVEPRWLPPAHTPGEDVIKRDDQGRWHLDRDLLGPSYRSAYGLGMLIHHRISNHRGKEFLVDRGIRTHGTGNTLSLGRSDSHGCHRLLGLHINRLAAFLLRHRHSKRHGIQPTLYRQTFHHKKTFSVTLRERGYRFELTPPIPVRVGPEQSLESSSSGSVNLESHSSP